MNETTLNLIACKNYLTNKFKALQMVNFQYRSEYDSMIEFITDCLQVRFNDIILFVLNLMYLTHACIE